MTVSLLGLVGSLRRASVHGALARAAIASAPDGVSLTLHSLDDLPFYDGDVESAGLPASVAVLQEAVAVADGLIHFSPEYNGSFPAVTKNAIDWLSRPPRLIEGTATTMITITPGPRAGLGVRTHFSDIMARQPVRLFDETLGFGRYRDRLDDDGEITDPDTIAELVGFLGRFAAFAAAPPPAVD
ncbi:MAG: NADPH-dependent FMN reductase [Actinomycetota bacterium]